MYTHKKHKQCFSTLVMHTENYQQGVTVSMSFLQNPLVHVQRMSLHYILLIPCWETVCFSAISSSFDVFHHLIFHFPLLYFQSSSQLG